MVLAFGLLPFFVIPVSWITMAQSKVAIILLLVVVAGISWVTARLFEGAIRIPVGTVLAAAALLPLAYLISVLAGGITSSSLFGTGVEQDTLAVACVWFSALLLSAFILSDDPSRAIGSLRALGIGGFVLVVLQIVHLFFPSTLSLGGVLASQTANAIGSWHDLSITLGFFVILGTAQMLNTAMPGKWRFLFGIVAIFSLLFLVVASFFDVWVTLATVSFLFIIHRLFIDWRAGWQNLQIKQYVIWTILAIAATCFSIWGGTISNSLPPSVRVANLEVRPSLQGTYIIGQQALTHPRALLFGSGPNTFPREWGLYKPAEINMTPFWNFTFNAGFGAVPTSLITLGTVGVIAWLVLLISILWMIGKILFARASSMPTTPYLQVAQPIAMATIFLFAFHVFFVPGPALSMMTFLFLGLLIAFAARSGLYPMRTLSIRTPDWVGRTRMAGILVFVLIIVFSSFGLGRVLASEMILNYGIDVYNKSKDIQRSSSIINMALDVFPSDHANRTAVEFGLLNLQQLIAKADPGDAKSKEKLQATLEETIKHGLAAVSINGGDYENWLALASLYQQLAGAKIENAYDNARAAYIRAREENPKNPFPYLQLAQLDFLQNKPAVAIQDLVEATKLKPDIAFAYYFGSQIYASQSDFKNAIPAAAEAVRYAPDDPLGWYNLGLITYVGKDYADAAVALQQALIREPQYANALYVLGLTYYQTGQFADAIRILEQLDKLAPEQKAVTDLPANLRAGKPQQPAPVQKGTSSKK